MPSWVRTPSTLHSGWKAEIPGIKDYLGPEHDQATVDAAVTGITHALREWAEGAGVIWLQEDERVGQEMDDIICDLEGCVGEDADELNRVLWDLYDWADGWRFIIGGRPKD